MHLHMVSVSWLWLCTAGFKQIEVSHYECGDILQLTYRPAAIQNASCQQTSWSKGRTKTSHLHKSSRKLLQFQQENIWLIYIYIYIYIYVSLYQYIHMGVSKNRGTPKWMVYYGKPYQNGWFGGKTHYFRNIHISISSCVNSNSSFWHFACRSYPSCYLKSIFP